MKTNGEKTHNGISLKSGIAGAVIGAGAAVVAMKVLSDEKVKESISETVNGLRDSAAQAGEKMEHQAKRAKSKAVDLADKMPLKQ